MKFLYYVDAQIIVSQETTAASNIYSHGEVLNGIAFDGTHFILTGKHYEN